MELFRYRSLAFACGIFLIFLIASFYVNIIIRIAILILVGIAIFIFIFLYAIKRTDKSFNLMIFGVPAYLFIILAFILSVAVFDKDKSIENLYNGEEYEAVATIESVDYSSETMGIYRAKIHTINKEKANIRVSLTVYDTPLNRNDVVSIKGAFTGIKSSKIGFDEKTYNLSLGVVACMTCEEYTLLGRENNYIGDMLDNSNSFLNERLKGLNEDTHAMLSALFLGNKRLLSDSVKMDFTRIGMSHALALSGMHITIIITSIGFCLKPLRISEFSKSLIIMAVTLFFVGMTGFSDSAMRAGFMVLITYFVSFFGKRIDMVTALFTSVTLICILDPYSIFSVSLVLSFFAMLGCLVSGKLIRRLKLYRVIRKRILRFIAFSLICTFLSLATTLPYTFTVFGNITILSFLTNIALSPVFSLLIYLTPVYLIVADIPYVGEFIGVVCEKITGFLIYIGNKLSRLDGIVLPIKNYIQIFAIVLLGIATLMLIVLKREYIKHVLCVMLASVVIFTVGYGVLLYERHTGVYVDAYSTGENDIIAIESKGDITVIDITGTREGYYAHLRDISNYLGYYEIENYILMELSYQTDRCFQRLSENIVIKNAYIPKPQNDYERDTYNAILEIAEKNGVNIKNLSEIISINDIYIEIVRDFSQNSSSKCICAVSVSYEGNSFLYLGASAFESEKRIIKEFTKNGDYVVFGSYGPKYEQTFMYNLPEMDYCLFFGNSRSFANRTLLYHTYGKEIEYKGYPLRFRLDF